MNPSSVILSEVELSEESPLYILSRNKHKQRSFALLRMTGVLICLLLNNLSFAQDPLTQTIRGTVIDMDSRIGLPNANVILQDLENIMGTATDLSGNFVLKEVPVGRQNIRISYTGYQTVVLTELYMSTGKELVLEIEMKQLIETMDEVEVVADFRKDRPINSMAVVSARSFSVEETNKYAGSYGDPARMAANYAGVLSSRDNRNDIIIRGNSPIGLQYRINGIEVTNPNHFGAQGTTGGPITILNTNLLANSDFFTGAFPAEYGNALAGIFDLRMRNGNTENYEFWGQLGWNGLEFGAEGPFSRKNGSSFVAAYRYSVTDIIEKLGIQLGESARYQDLNLNLNFPTNKAGIFSLIGVAGKSGITKKESEEEQDKWTFSTHGENLRSNSSMGMFGLGHHHFFDPSASIQTRLSVSGNSVETQIDTFSVNYMDPYTKNGEKSTELIYGLYSNFTKKFSAASVVEAGVKWDYFVVDYADSIYYKTAYVLQTNSRAQFSLLQAFTQWHYRTSNKLSGTIGLHYQYFTLNGTQLLEPRGGIKYEISNTNRLSFGVGLHSQTQARVMYFVQTPVEGQSDVLTNNQMDFSKSLQFVIGYDHLFSENLRLKVESYYQYLYDVPVKESIPQYSILNEGTEFFVDRVDSLVNLGSGTNYGLELTLEKFLSNNYFFLVTASLFQSNYKAYDGIERSTSFNSNFIINAVGGYELPFGKRKNRSLVLGLRMTYTGGRPYLPYDQEATVASGHVVYDWDNAYHQRYDDYFRTTFRIGLRRNERKFNVSFLFDISYRANYTYIYTYRIDVTNGAIVQDFKMGWYPNSTVRFQF